jgi:dihydroorotate dehydrogenase electron transfer subunit
VNLLGPLGNSFEPPRVENGSAPRPLPEEEEKTAVVLVAGGIGIAPLMEWMHQLKLGTGGGFSASSLETHLFYGARTAAELLPPESFGGLGVKVHWCTDDGSFGYHGLVTRLLQETVQREKLKPAVVYACGPLAMQFHVARWALANGTASQLSLEALMACGLGACLGCALPAHHPTDPTADFYVHVCKDGPIFSAGSIKWQKIQLYRTAPPTFLCS